MKLRFLGGRFQGRIADVTDSPFTIGRGHRNDLVLDQDGVSRYHTRLVCEGERWYVEDLESTNGVRLNGKRIEGKQPIRPDDRIGISGNLLLFTDDSASATDLPPGALDDLDFTRQAVPVGSAAEEAAAHETDVGAHDELGEASGEAPDGEPADDFPWARVVLLVIVLLVLGILGIDYLCSQFGQDAERETETTGEVTPATGESDGTAAGDEESLWDTAAEFDGGLPGGDTGGEDDVPSPGRLPVPPADEEPAQPAAGVEADADQNGTQTQPATPAGTWYAVIRSEPEGAVALVDEEEVGPTPVVAELKPGRHRLVLKHPGYEELKRLIDPQVLYPQGPFSLRPLPGAVLVRSTPSGAAVLHGRQLLGKTPQLVQSLPPGGHTLTLVRYGYSPEEVSVTVSKHRNNEVSAQLTRHVGTLEIVTYPGEAEVRINGVLKGKTEAENSKAVSAPLVIDNMLAGRHHWNITHPVSGTRDGIATVKAGETVRRKVRCWYPDVEVSLRDGRNVYALLQERGEDGGVTVESAAGKVRRLSAAQTQEVRKLSEEEIADYLESNADMLAAGVDSVEHVDQRVPAAQTLPQGVDARLTAKRFDREVGQATLGELRDQFNGKVVEARGVPGRIVGAEDILHVWLGDSVHCRLPPAVLAQLRTAKQKGLEITVRGRVTDCNADGIILSECQLVARPTP